MSADYDDDDVWDEPVIDVVTENKIIELNITTISKTELEQIREMAIYASNQKLQKLNIVLQNMSVYVCDDTLLVNDKYNICPELIKISKALGLDIKLIECNLKGKSYIINDKLTNLIKAIDSTYNYEECVSNIKIIKEVKELIQNNKFTYNTNSSLSRYLHEIVRNGKLTIEGTQKIISTYEDGRLVGQEKQDIISNKDEINKTLTKFLFETSEVLKTANDNLRDGTAELLYSRARQMGYAVEESRNGDKIELVLVRYE